MNHIANVGGVFIYARDAKKLADWYTENLGLELVPYGATVFGCAFEYTEPTNGKPTSLVWSIMQNTERPVSDERVFTVNYRTLDLRALVAHLEQKGVEVKPIQEHGEGLFAWCRDPEGNYLELWQDSQA